jgi:hypothetical protein
MKHRCGSYRFVPRGSSVPPRSGVGKLYGRLMLLGVTFFIALTRSFAER